MTGLLRDLRFALRQLGKSPVFTLATMGMLALGICANGTIFSWINSTLLHPVPGATHMGDLVSLMRGARVEAPSPPFSYPDYRDLRDRNHSFLGILGYRDDWMMLTGDENPERVYGANTTANYFDVLGVKPYLGRFFLPAEETPDGAPAMVVLGYSLWKTHLGGDRAILGKPVELYQRPFTVIGVAPEGFIGCKTGVRTDLWMPLFISGVPGGNSWAIHRQNTILNVTGRLRPGVDLDAAAQDLDLQMRRIVAAYPDEHRADNAISLYPLWRSPFGANVYLASSLPPLLGLAAVVLLLTCANVATLLLVRFVARRREMAIRQSLGANRIQLMRQMMLEGLMLALGGGALALMLTDWSAKRMQDFIPASSSPIVLNGTLDWNVAAAIVLLAAFSSLLCGTLPAWRSSRVSPAEVLKDEAGSVTSGAQNQILLSGLVVAQIALSLTLLITAGLFFRTLTKTNGTDPGFDRSHVLLATVEPDSVGYTNAETKTFQRNLRARLQALPGIESVALSDWVPLTFTRGSLDAYPEGYEPKPHESMEVRRASISAAYFETMKIPLLEGRDFTLQDNEDAPRVAIVDETMAHHFWPGQNAIGKRMRIHDNWVIVVGVAKNSSHQSVHDAPEPLVYLSIFQTSYLDTIIQLRARGDVALRSTEVEEAVHAINAKLAVFDVRTLEESTRMASMFEVTETTFAGAFGLLALILAASGIYGVMAYRTALRTHEIGIRVALGASRSDVLMLVMRQGMKLAAAGIVLGLAMSLVLTRVVRGLLYGISAMDPLAVLSGTLVLLAIAAAAIYLPALKAMHTDPVDAIRAQ